MNIDEEIKEAYKRFAIFREKGNKFGAKQEYRHIQKLKRRKGK